MTNYFNRQLKFIYLYAKHLHIDDEKAAWLWVTTGLAAHYAEILWLDDNDPLFFCNYYNSLKLQNI